MPTRVLIRECRIPFTFSSNPDEIVADLNVKMTFCWDCHPNYTCPDYFARPHVCIHS